MESKWKEGTMSTVLYEILRELRGIKQELQDIENSLEFLKENNCPESKDISEATIAEINQMTKGSGKSPLLI